MDSDRVHELNNALLPVRAYGELAIRKVDRGEDCRPELEELLAAVDRATALARALKKPREES